MPEPRQSRAGRRDPSPSATNATRECLPVAEKLLSAEEAIESIQEYAGLRFYRGDLYGVSFDAGSGCNRLCRFEAGKALSLLPDSFSVRSRVHEYGGGAWCPVAGRLCFVNDSDQQIWCHSLDSGRSPQPLTAMPDTRFADLQYDRRRQRLLAISEQHREEGREPVNRLTAIDLNSGQVQILAEGADFYSSPALNPAGDRLAWVEWDHPCQPWLCTRLMLAELGPEGKVTRVQQVSDRS